MTYTKSLDHAYRYLEYTCSSLIKLIGSEVTIPDLQAIKNWDLQLVQNCAVNEQQKLVFQGIILAKPETKLFTHFILAPIV